MAALTRQQKEQLRALCADAVSRVEWTEALADSQIPESDAVWAYLRTTEARIHKALGHPRLTHA